MNYSFLPIFAPYFSRVRPGDPVQVQWESTAVFTTDSVVIPTPDFLNGVLEESLNDPQDYLNELSMLNTENPFSTTTDAMFATPQNPPPSSSSTTTTRNTGANVSGIIGAAAGLTVVLAAFVLYRNRRVVDDGSDASKKSGKGDTTVAGDTFMEDTHASSADGDDGSTKNSKTSGMFWNTSNHNNNERHTSKASVQSPSRQAVEDFDAFVSCRDDLGSMSDVLSEALASCTGTDEAESKSQDDVHPLDSTLRRLKKDIDGMKMELDDESNVRPQPARRPKTVAEIEQLLADGKGFGR